jgi:hypothetical protein
MTRVRGVSTHRFVKAASVILAGFLALVLLGAVVLLFLPADLYGAPLREVRLVMRRPIFFAGCGLCAAAIYGSIFFFEERPFGGIDRPRLWTVHIFFANTTVALILLRFVPMMPSVAEVKGSTLLTCLLGFSFIAVFFAGLDGVTTTLGIAKTDYRRRR